MLVMQNSLIEMVFCKPVRSLVAGENGRFWQNNVGCDTNLYTVSVQ